MNFRQRTMVLVFIGLVFTSCKNQDSKNVSSETDKIESEEGMITPKLDNGTDDAQLVAAVKEYITTNYLTEDDLRAIPKDDRKFQLSQIDLNNDGEKEVFVNFINSYFCGTGGCSILLLNNKIEPITKFTVKNTPLYINQSVENGWRTIMTQSEGKWRKLIYKDGSYPSNPSLVEVSKNPPNEAASIIFGNDNNELKTHSF